MRIIAGLAKGRLIKTLPGDTVRPTADRVREAIFNILGPQVEGLRVLDLFAGSGALGLEALSRQAAFTVFVEKSKKASFIIQENLEGLNFKNGQIFSLDAFRALSLFERKKESFNLIFADPPYRLFEEKWILDLWKCVSGLLLKPGIFVVEHPFGWSSPQFPLLPKYDVRKYGQTGISFYQKLPEVPFV